MEESPVEVAALDVAMVSHLKRARSPPPGVVALVKPGDAGEAAAAAAGDADVLVTATREVVMTALSKRFRSPPVNPVSSAPLLSSIDSSSTSPSGLEAAAEGAGDVGVAPAVAAAVVHGTVGAGLVGSGDPGPAEVAAGEDSGVMEACVGVYGGVESGPAAASGSVPVVVTEGVEGEVVESSVDLHERAVAGLLEGLGQWKQSEDGGVLAASAAVVGQLGGVAPVAVEGQGSEGPSFLNEDSGLEL